MLPDAEFITIECTAHSDIDKTLNAPPMQFVYDMNKSDMRSTLSLYKSAEQASASTQSTKPSNDNFKELRNFNITNRCRRDIQYIASGHHKLIVDAIICYRTRIKFLNKLQSM